MAYLCPVCAEPQVDAEHLANHLAFVAVIRGGAHETWLDEHAPGWDEEDESALADRLRESEEIEPVEHPIDEIEAETHGGGRGPDHADHGAGGDPLVDGSAAGGDAAALDDEAREILDDARELTREMSASEGETE